jgi:hypothetical protein
VMAHQNKVPNGPSSEQLAALFEQIFSRYPKASAIGFATIPSPDEGWARHHGGEPDDPGRRARRQSPRSPALTEPSRHPNRPRGEP